MVTHIMSDGTKRNSIQGVIVPPGHPVYGILKAIFSKGVDGSGSAKTESQTAKSKTA